MLTISRRLGQNLLKRSTATATAAAAAANKAHTDPATWAVNYNLQERDRIDNSINANRDLIYENHKYINGRFDDHRQQMDAKLDEKLKLVDDKFDSALERLLKSMDSLKKDLQEMREETKKDYHALDKNITVMTRSAAFIVSAITLGLTFAHRLGFLAP